MAAGVACGLQNRYGARGASRAGSTPVRLRHVNELREFTPFPFPFPFPLPFPSFTFRHAR